MVKYLSFLLLLFSLPLMAQNGNTGRNYIKQTYTVAGLPASPPTGTTVVVSNGNSATDCTSGGGSNYVFCVYNGSAWASIGGGSGGGANTGLSNLSGVAINSALLPGTTNTIALGSSSNVWSNVYGTNLTSNSDIAVGNATGDVLDIGHGPLDIGSNIAFGSGALASTNNVNQATNLAIGHNALAQATSDWNMAIGYAAMYHETGSVGAEAPGSQNLGIGVEALFNNSTGVDNTALGHETLFTNTTGYDDTALGYNAEYYNTTGCCNTAVGQEAMLTNTTGQNNVAVGFDVMNGTGVVSNDIAIGINALSVDNSGGSNLAIGSNSLQQNSSGSANLGVGFETLAANTTQSNNTAVGSGQTLYQATAANNTAVGASAMYSDTTGGNNTALGYAALATNVSGTNNVAIGMQALDNGSTGSYDTAVGFQAGYNASYTNSTAIGNGALNSASNQISLGNTSVNSLLIAGTAGLSQSGVLCTATFTTVVGIVTACTATSDPRLKTFQPYSHGLDAILGIHPIHFHWNEEGLKVNHLTGDSNLEQIGFNAANIRKFIPEAVGKDENGYLTMPYGDRPIVAALVNAVQEQQRKIEELTKQLEDLKAQLGMK